MTGISPCLALHEKETERGFFAVVFGIWFWVVIFWGGGEGIVCLFLTSF